MKEGLNVSKNTYYWTCPYCKANLDPNEWCDCQKEKEDSPITKQSDTDKDDKK